MSGSGISDRELERALDLTLLRSTRSITLGLAALYAVLAAIKPLALGGGASGVATQTVAFLTALEVALAAGFATLHHMLRFHIRSPRAAHPLAALLTGALLADSALHMLLLQKPLESLSFMLIALGVAFFYYSPRWFIIAEAIVAWTWALSAWFSPTPSIPAEASPWIDLSLAMFEAMVLAGIIFAVRLRDRRRLESLLWSDARLQEALARANQELEAFNYSVSHDLRAPVRAVDGFARAILDRHGSAMAEEAVGYVGHILRAGQRMNELIDDQLELARVSKAEMVRVRVDVTALCWETVRVLLGRDPQRVVAVHVQEGIVVYGDPGLLLVAFENLLGNAWKYTSRRPDARIDVEWDTWATGGRVTVRDNGVGFDPAHAARLFRPFSRLHHSEEFPGTGVGLAIVERIVRRHDGVIEADAQPGVGARFSVTFPSPVT